MEVRQRDRDREGEEEKYLVTHEKALVEFGLGLVSGGGRVSGGREST
jgi:hypothetical protein